MTHEAIRRAIYDWIREDAPLVMKMRVTPELVGELAKRLEAVYPHSWIPSAMHMGDCAICGNIATHSLHIAADDEARPKTEQAS